MIVEDVGLEAMRGGVGAVLGEWRDVVVPSEVDCRAANQYSPRYAWMFSYEKRLRDRLQEALGRRLGAVERLLFGADGVFSEALSNAFVHGHRRDPDRPIEVTSVVGTRRLAFAVRDTGPGFDIRPVLEGLARGGTYFHNAGNGLRALHQREEVLASFTGGGSVLNLSVGLHSGSG